MRTSAKQSESLEGEAPRIMASEEVPALSKTNKKRLRPPVDVNIDAEDDLDLSSDLKGIITALQQFRDKAHKDGLKKTDEIIKSVASDIKSMLDEAKIKFEKDRQNVIRVASRTCKECENALKSESEKFKTAHEKFCKEKALYLQSYSDIFSKFEENKEKLLAKYEQQRKKEKNAFSDLQKACADKIAIAEDSLKKKKQGDKSFSILRKSLGSFLQSQSDEEDIDA